MVELYPWPALPLVLHFLRSGRPSANVASSLVTAAKSTLNRQNARAVIVSALTATSATETVLAAGRQAMSIVGQTSGGTAAAVKVGVAEAVHRAATDLSAAAGSPAAVDGLHTLLSNLKLLLASLASEESLSPVVARFTVMVANAAARAVAAAAPFTVSSSLSADGGSGAAIAECYDAMAACVQIVSRVFVTPLHDVAAGDAKVGEYCVGHTATALTELPSDPVTPQHVTDLVLSSTALAAVDTGAWDRRPSLGLIEAVAKAMSLLCALPPREQAPAIADALARGVGRGIGSWYAGALAVSVPVDSPAVGSNSSNNNSGSGSGVSATPSAAAVDISTTLRKLCLAYTVAVRDALRTAGAPVLASGSQLPLPVALADAIAASTSASFDAVKGELLVASATPLDVVVTATAVVDALRRGGYAASDLAVVLGDTLALSLSSTHANDVRAATRRLVTLREVLRGSRALLVPSGDRQPMRLSNDDVTLAAYVQQHRSNFDLVTLKLRADDVVAVVRAFTTAIAADPALAAAAAAGPTPTTKVVDGAGGGAGAGGSTAAAPSTTGSPTSAAQSGSSSSSSSSSSEQARSGGKETKEPSPASVVVQLLARDTAYAALDLWSRADLDAPSMEVDVPALPDGTIADLVAIMKTGGTSGVNVAALQVHAWHSCGVCLASCAGVVYVTASTDVVFVQVVRRLCGLNSPSLKTDGGKSTVNTKRVTALSEALLFRELVLSLHHHADDRVYLRETLRLLQVGPGRCLCVRACMGVLCLLTDPYHGRC